MLPDFQYIEYLWLLLAIPLFLVIMLISRWRQKRRLSAFGNTDVLTRLSTGVSPKWAWLRRGFFLLGLFFLIIAFANPRSGKKRITSKQKTIDAYIALDVSSSMLVEDAAPKNRLEKGRQLALSLIELLKGDRVGIIIFAGEAELMMPLSTDYAAAKTFVNSIQANMLTRPGTSLAEAVGLVQKQETRKIKRPKALLVISDGEQHEGDAKQAVAEARKNGVTTFPIGVGTEEGGFIPEIINGFPQLKKDASGNLVKSRLNAALLQDLANEGGGTFYYLNDEDQLLADLEKKLQGLEFEDTELLSFDQFRSFYQLFLCLAFVFFILEYILPWKITRA